MLLREGVSPYVAALLMTMLVLTVGGILLAAALGLLSRYSSLSVEQVSEIERMTRSRLTLLSSYINGTKLVVLLYSGDISTKILGVYVNGTLANSLCNVSIARSSTVALGSGIDIPADSPIAIECDLSTYSSNPVLAHVIS